MGALRAGLVAIGVFLIAIGVMTLILGGEYYLSTSGGQTFWGISTGGTIYVKSAWGLYAQIGGGVLTALGLAITVFGALKK